MRLHDVEATVQHVSTNSTFSVVFKNETTEMLKMLKNVATNFQQIIYMFLLFIVENSNI